MSINPPKATCDEWGKARVVETGDTQPLPKLPPLGTCVDTRLLQSTPRKYEREWIRPMFGYPPESWLDRLRARVGL